jgi:hypothetical protein
MIQGKSQEAIERLGELFRSLINQPMLKRGDEWQGKWPGWEQPYWRGECCGVYVLWKDAHDPENDIPPVYVGEGLTGVRVWESFHSRTDWMFAQILYDEVLDEVNQGLNWRRLLERFAIVVLNPVENRG